MVNSLTEIVKIGSRTIHKKVVDNKIKYVPTNLDGCVLYLPMEEKTINLSLDHSGYNNHGAIYGAIESDGKIGKGLSFDGIDDYVDCGNPVIFNIGIVSLIAWVKVIGPGDSGMYSRIIEKHYSNSDYLGLNNNDTKFKACFADGTSPYGLLESVSIITYGQWYHVVAIHDGINDYLYINNVLESTRSNTRVLNNSTEKVYLGKMPLVGTHRFNGIIDEARIYSKALTEQEVLASYQQEL